LLLLLLLLLDYRVELSLAGSSSFLIVKCFAYLKEFNAFELRRQLADLLPVLRMAIEKMFYNHDLHRNSLQLLKMDDLVLVCLMGNVCFYVPFSLLALILLIFDNHYFPEKH